MPKDTAPTQETEHSLDDFEPVESYSGRTEIPNSQSDDDSEEETEDFFDFSTPDDNADSEEEE